MREWVSELTKTLFSEETGLFRITRSQDDISYFPNSKAKHLHPAEYKDYYRFAG